MLLFFFFSSLRGDYEGLFLRPIRGGNKSIIAKLETKYPVYLTMKLVSLHSEILNEALVWSTFPPVTFPLFKKVEVS